MKTRKEISVGVIFDMYEDTDLKSEQKIACFRLSDLPTSKRNRTVPGKFYLISPFIGPLKAFIHDRKHFVRGVKEELQSSSVVCGASPVFPQYSAARVHDSTIESTVSTATPDPARQVTTTTLDTGDSHLAGLPSGLVHSAASVALDDTTKAQSTPGGASPAPASSPCYPVPARPSGSPDWSAGAATKLPAPMERLLADAWSPAISPQPQGRPPPQTGSAPIAPSATSPSLAAAGGAGQARPGSTGISPYLSHSRSIARETRYISVLKGVAQESDRAATATAISGGLAAPR
ncbi:hypothetical protein LXA43DRAFT_1125365 [Ganoderma leucocontextum]|nr:hypothetical protein LXA43DRAFT_1101953 [Ganoderma leucocontextum]KAI1783935.1 hypothetical protein LXA43DRAFT_1128423 [Ganoderma leucocontextum]KAI1784132.1 hypothetical protein LXA43DRAFT_1125365 [Ganoderma leucocontextum]